MAVVTSGLKWLIKTSNADHGAWAAKVDLRQRVMELLTPPQTVVFDAFAGPGLMFKEVWRHAAGYVGCDTTWYSDDRLCYVCDNRRALRCLDLKPYTCFDLDSYGSPWEQALIIAARRRVRPGERLGFAMTDGAGINTRLAGMPGGLGTLAGLNRAAGHPGINHDELIDRAILGLITRMRCRVEKQWRAIGVTGAGVRYVGLVIEGVGHGT